MGLDTDIRRGQAAKELLENPAFQEAIDKLGAHLESKVLGCDPDNLRQAQRVVLAKQILRGLVREIQRVAESGDLAAIKLDEIEAQKVTSFRR